MAQIDPYKDLCGALLMIGLFYTLFIVALLWWRKNGNL